jgi:hypothetical protein
VFVNVSVTGVTSDPFRKNDYRRDSSVTAMLQDLKWQPLADRRRDQQLILLYKIINDIYKHSFIPRSTIDWNSLPEATVTSKTILCSV